MTNDYRKALEAAGAEVKRFASFGGDEGEWWAEVSHGLERGWVCGNYGFDPFTDAYEMRFCDEPEIESKALAAFGSEYLEDLMNNESAQLEAYSNLGFTDEAANVLAFLRGQEETK